VARDGGKVAAVIVGITSGRHARETQTLRKRGI